MSKKIKRLTEQQAFNKVWRWFVRDKKPQSIKDGCCMYRGPMGARCAAGVCIPDSLYTKELEGSILTREVARFIPILEALPEGRLMPAMQALHDVNGVQRRPAFTARMREGLMAIAKEYRLKVPSR